MDLKPMLLITLIILLFETIALTVAIVTIHADNQLITAYTPKNIYYLEGKTVSDENGVLKDGVTFPTRNQAINFFEEQTVEDAQ